MKLPIKIRRSKICSLTDTFGNSGWSTEIAVPASQTDEEEISFVLGKDKLDREKSMNNAYLQFYTREEYFCLFGEEYTLIGENIVWGNMYIFDDQIGQHNEKHIIPVKRLSEFTEIINLDAEVLKVISENPERICLLWLHNTNIVWLDKFFRVSELRPKS